MNKVAAHYIITLSRRIFWKHVTRGANGRGDERKTNNHRDTETARGRREKPVAQQNKDEITADRNVVVCATAVHCCISVKVTISQTAQVVAVVT